MDEETKYWVAFSVFPGIGPVRFKLLCDYFGSAGKAFRADSETLRSIHLPEKLVAQFLDFRKTFDAVDYLRQLDEKHIHVITLNDPHYPKLLAKISDPPFILYIKGIRGKQPINLNRTIGIVGTRNITPYGEEVTRRLVTELVAAGFTIVSGMAYGVDAVAHQTALDACGQTIAVLGCGADVIAPPVNTGLYHRITEGGNGAIISEMPLGLRPNKGLFPARNRIISGLSLGVVVTEGADDSGALITARNAAEQGREVFAVPGPITSKYSRGPAKLLKNGAKLVESAADILEELNIPKLSSAKLTNQSDPTYLENASAPEKKILGYLADRRAHIDEVTRGTGLTIAEVASNLTVLEMKGVIVHLGDDTYTIN
jgi:DNA processing protein